MLRESVQNSPYPVKELRNVYTDIAGGATPYRADTEQYADSGIRFLRIMNVTEQGINLDDVKYVTQDVHEKLLNRSQLRLNDVLMTITGRIGTAAKVSEDILPANINQHIVRLRLDPEQIDPDYLVAYLNSDLGTAITNQGVTGATRIALDYQAIAKVPIVCPPLAVQQELVAKIDAARARRADLLRQADEELANIDVYISEVIGIK